MHAQQIKKEMNIFVMINVMRDLLAMDQFAGRVVQIISRVTELTVTSHMLMEEELVKRRDARTVRSGELSGIQNAKKTSIMLDAASALQIAQFT